MEKDTIKTGYYINGRIYNKFFKPDIAESNTWSYNLMGKYVPFLDALGPSGGLINFIIVEYAKFPNPTNRNYVSLYHAKPIPSWKRIR